MSSGQELLEYIEKHKHRVGIIALTEAKDNLLMWSHYANEHRGAVIGINTSEFSGGNIFAKLQRPQLVNTSFYEDYDVFTGKINPVIYRKQPRYRVDMFDFDYSNISVEGEDRILFEIFHQKSDEWIYEREHRIVLRLEQADRVVIHDINQIGNQFLQKAIIDHPSFRKNEQGDDNSYIAYLEEIDDEAEREGYAVVLSKLASNPANLYLFRLDSSSICSLILGVNSSRDKIDIGAEYPRRTGYFDVYKASLSESFYALGFEPYEE